MDDIDSAFDNIVMFENRSQEKGFTDGYSHGKRLGRMEGEKLGSQHGSKLGSELGFYSGFAEAWKEILSKEENPKERILKTLQTITDMVSNFPKDDPQNESIQENMLKIRAKFKQLCSLLNVHPNEFSDKGISF